MTTIHEKQNWKSKKLKERFERAVLGCCTADQELSRRSQEEPLPQEPHLIKAFASSSPWSPPPLYSRGHKRTKWKNKQKPRAAASAMRQGSYYIGISQTHTRRAGIDWTRF
jgi:hypothetical protein